MKGFVFIKYKIHGSLRQGNLAKEMENSKYPISPWDHVAYPVSRFQDITQGQT